MCKKVVRETVTFLLSIVPRDHVTVSLIEPQLTISLYNALMYSTTGYFRIRMEG